MAIRLHVEDEHTIPLSVSGGDSVEMKHSEAFINAISPTARVDQTEDGAVITITDKNGTTTAEISDAEVTAENIEEALGYVPANERIKSAIFFGQCDSTSTATKFTAQIDGITEYFDGLTILLKNGVVESKTGCTFNINGLGEKGAWGTYELSRVSTMFTVTRVYVFIYDSSLDEGNGGFWAYQGKDSNDNTAAYWVRTNYGNMPVSSTTYRYRLLFTSADKTHYVPANNSTSTNSTAKRDVNQEKIDPFGKIAYYSSTNDLLAEERPTTASQWIQYNVPLGYSFNRSGKALTLTPWKPVYIKATPYADGSAIIDADEPYVQDLPVTEDGKIYIHLGIAYSSIYIELLLNHPVYYYHNGGVQLWTGPSTHAELEKLYNAFPVDSASGDVASFADGADNVPLKSLTIGIDPVQDLHGYSNPWPAGGGINKFDKDNASGWTNSAYLKSDGTEVSAPSWSITDYIPIKGTTFTLSNVGGGVPSICLYDANKTFLVGAAYNTQSSAALTNVTIVSTVEAAYARFSIHTAQDTSIIQLEVGSAATAWSPYSNICPISGWTGANVVRTGKNLLVDYGHTWNVNGQYAVANGALASALLPVTPGENFSCRKKVAFTGTNCNLMVRIFDSNKNFIVSRTILRYNELQSTYAIPSNAYYVAFVQFFPQETITPEQYDAYQVQIEKSDVVTEYETPVNPYLYLITFPSEAGIVYGGSLDVLTGVLTVDRVKETFVFDNPSADSIYNLESQGFTLAKRSTAASNSIGKITNVCGAYAYAQANWHDGEPHFYVSTTSWTLYLTKNAYRGGNVELCYPLETPLTYQLTPTEVNSLLGQNNIYADTGGTSVEYRADIKAYINRKIAEAITALS